MADPRVIILDDGRTPPDLWLVELDERGTFKPLNNTDPIRMPASWVKAFDKARAAAGVQPSDGGQG